ncbi:MAG: hypothetical protein JXO22_14945 [Phycisphaerae bacterium]|nr:hypothetical protein [Phycisphaerae bacterium]
MNRVPFAVLALVVMVGVLAGCERKFTRERFDMITPGVDQKYDVRMMIGVPNRDMGSQWYYEDLDHYYAARVFFNADDVVRAKEWMDARAGTWEGRDPDTTPPVEGEVREEHTRTRMIDDD